MRRPPRAPRVAQNEPAFLRDVASTESSTCRLLGLPHTPPDSVAHQHPSSASAVPSYAARALAAGAHGYVNKAVDSTELLNAIRAVSRGEQVIPPGVEQLLASGDAHPASALTAREQQVMEMLARGMTNREIAQHL